MRLLPYCCSVCMATATALGGNASPFGVCSHITRDEDPDAIFARCVEAGIRNVRADLGWYMLQNRPEEWKAAKYTNLLAKARAAGVTVPPQRFWTSSATQSRLRPANWRSAPTPSTC